jgi:glycosyltransferase involved in cell wall biosynthesis
MTNKNVAGAIRVLHVLGGKMDLGGIEVFLMNYFRNVDREVLIFDFLVTEQGDGFFDEEIKSLGGNLHSVVSKRIHPIRHIINTLKILRLYKDLPIHLHLDGMNGLYSVLARLSGAKTIISHSHNTDHLTTNKIKRAIHNLFIIIDRLSSNYYAACSKNASLWLHGKNSSKFNWIPNAIDTKNFRFNTDSRRRLRDELSLGDSFVIGHIGRFHDQKNHTFMIDVARQLLNQKVDFKMLFIGEGQLRDNIEQLITSYDLQDNMILLGRRTNANELLSAMDLFVFPSLYEGLGIASVEAQYNGLQVISSKALPDEAIICDNVRLLELDIKKWVNVIVNASIESEYIRDNLVLTNKSYDINEAAKQLVEFYKEMT